MPIARSTEPLHVVRCYFVLFVICYFLLFVICYFLLFVICYFLLFVICYFVLIVICYFVLFVTAEYKIVDAQCTFACINAFIFSIIVNVL